jgi:hypothetical protein
MLLKVPLYFLSERCSYFAAKILIGALFTLEFPARFFYFQTLGRLLISGLEVRVLLGAHCNFQLSIDNCEIEN